MKKVKIKVIGAKDFYIVPEQFLDIKEIVGKKLKPIKAKIIGAKDFYIISEVFLPEGINPIDFISSLVPSWENPNPALYNFYSFGENPSPFSYIKRKILYSPIISLKIAGRTPLRRVFKAYPTSPPHIQYPPPTWSHFHPRIKLEDMTRWVNLGDVANYYARVIFVYPDNTQISKNFTTDEIKVLESEFTNILLSSGQDERKIIVKVYPWGDFQDRDDEVWFYEIWVSPKVSQPIRWIHEPIELTVSASWVERIIDENTGRTWTRGGDWPPSWNDENFGDKTSLGTISGEQTFSNPHTFTARRLTYGEEGRVRFNQSIQAKIHSNYYYVSQPIKRQQTFLYLYSLDPTQYPLWFRLENITNRTEISRTDYPTASIPYELINYVDTIERTSGNRIKVNVNGGRTVSGSAKGHPYYDVVYSSLILPSMSNNAIFHFPESYGIFFSNDNRVYQIDWDNNIFYQFNNPYLSTGRMGAYTWEISDDNRYDQKVIKIYYLDARELGRLERWGITIRISPLSSGDGARIDWVSLDMGSRRWTWFISLTTNTHTYVIVADLDFLKSPAISYYSATFTPLTITYQFFGDLWGRNFAISGNTLFSFYFDLYSTPKRFQVNTFNLSYSPSAIIVMRNRYLGLIGNQKKFYETDGANIREYAWNSVGNINRGQSGSYDNSGNINIFTFPDFFKSIPGYASFGIWGGRLIYTKDISSIISSSTFTLSQSFNLSNALPSELTINFEIFLTGLSPNLSGSFFYLPNT